MLTELNPSCRISSLNEYYDFRTEVDVLRLDELHPVISGNKWFKLQVYLREAVVQHKTLLTFGGAFSNHIVATAAAARMSGLAAVGLIRGERIPQLSHTLLQAQALGMQLFFLSREDYKQKSIPPEVEEQFPPGKSVIIPEGGYGPEGAEGAAEILLKNNSQNYTHIISAAGTGTTLAGLRIAAVEKQKVIGVSVFKNNFSLQEEINALLPPSKKDGFTLLHDYHFGGYAKHKPALIHFMNDFFRRSGISTDFVYTAKTFYGIFDLLQKDVFPDNDRLLLVHTGGLQGNLSLPKGTLIF